ncbi:MAG: 2Fe-2S iron-sulfur cluster binding domain-containing protein [Saprospiraceae bacterium]|nr:2Fe-2S iron-sulfur cluster binding domain-containing protein [Saprospiraceae bacterium]
MKMSFHSLKISKIVSETSDAKTIYFEIPANLKEVFQHKPGQHLTIRSTFKGKEVRRAYSLCTSPDAEFPGVTVKKVAKGSMSVYLNNHIKVGDMLDVMSPQGHFTMSPDHLKTRGHYFIAAGSGITPVMSMIQTITELEPKSTCYLLYGNRNEDSIIFKDLLEKISKKYMDQLHVTHILSQPHVKKSGGVAGLFTKKSIDWQGLKGRINTDSLKKFFMEYPSANSEKQYYICGPGDFIENTEAGLLSMNIDKKQIHKEYFTAAHESEHTDIGLENAVVRVTLKGDTFDIEIPKGKTILDTLVDKKKDPPYSCTSGACSTCMAKVTEGEVTMDSCYALDDDEIAAGYILTCQSHPKTQRIVLTYDV